MRPNDEFSLHSYLDYVYTRGKVVGHGLIPIMCTREARGSTSQQQKFLTPHNKKVNKSKQSILNNLEHPKSKKREKKKKEKFI